MKLTVYTQKSREGVHFIKTKYPLFDITPPPKKLLKQEAKLTEINKELYNEIGYLIREFNSMKDNISKCLKFRC